MLADLKVNSSSNKVCSSDFQVPTEVRKMFKEKVKKFWFYKEEVCISIMGSNLGTNSICIMQSWVQFSQKSAFPSEY